MSERELYWRGVVERQVHSGESVVEFCAAEGVSTASFYSWRKRLRVERSVRRSDVEDHRPQLVPVSVAAAAACVEVVLPKRWIVERTFAWLARYRRQSRDYEKTTASAEAMTYIAMTSLMSKRLARSGN